MLHAPSFILGWSTCIYFRYLIMSELMRGRRLPGVCITSALSADAAEEAVPTPAVTLLNFNIVTQVQNGTRIFISGPRCCGKTTLVERLLKTTRLKATVIEDGTAEDILELFTGSDATSASPALRIATACYASTDLFFCTDIVIVFPTTSQGVIHSWRLRVLPCFKTDSELITIFKTLIDMKDTALVFDANAFRTKRAPYLFWI